MPLSTTGPLSVWEIANEFGVANQMSSFYSLAEGIPASGLITIGDFRGKQFPTGQAVFTGAGTFTFTVPFGVKSISMVAVQAGSNYGSNITTVSVGGVVVCRASNGARIGDGGGDGGDGGGYYYDGYYYGGGGGGAGGYAGNGGAGQKYWTSGPGNGQGGGGGGGGHGSAGQDNPGGGGGVGLLGQGANGAGNGGYGTGGYGGSGGGNGVGRDGGLYGGGHGVGYSSSGTPGGALSYKNNVAVTPGQAVTIVIGPGQRGGATNNGAVRIIWGKNRAYPSTNTHDM